ncbi:MAG: phenylacetate--CoA ligase family protein [bacterium]|nr:phenylacetate--CoA ligase family protein [bacterium]
MDYSYENDFGSAQKEVAYAYENVPFFKKHMDDAQLAPNDIRRPEDFAKIPSTEKKHYRKGFPVNVLAKGFTLKDDRLSRFPSAGTTGERLLTVELGHIYMKRAMDCTAIYPLISSTYNSQPLRQIRYAAPNCSDVECANPNSTMADRLLSDGTLVLAVYHDLLTTPERILDQNAEELNSHQPQLYFIDSNHLAFLIRYMRNNKDGQVPPKAPILASYTPCVQVSKRQIFDALGRDVPFSEVIAMSELGFVAMQCPAGYMHLNTKSFYCELIRDNRPAEQGEMAELVISTMDTGCIPHIRYRTGDVYRFIGSECLCGHESPVVQMEGRLRNFFFRDGEVILTPRELDKIVGSSPWIDMYKMKQADENDFLFNFIPNEKYQEDMESKIRKNLLRKLGNDANLTIEKSDYIPTERSGKFLACVSSVGDKIYDKGFSL